MKRFRNQSTPRLVFFSMFFLLVIPACQKVRDPMAVDKTVPPIRIATFNISFNRTSQGNLKKQLVSGKGKNFGRVAKIIQTVRPEILLLNEFDYDVEGEGIAAFQANFLSKPQGDQLPIEYRYIYTAPVNTGVDTGLDLNRDQKLGTGQDAFGYGRFPGQYGMAILSMHPIQTDGVRTFQKFLWKDMPGGLLPIAPQTQEAYYSDKATAIFRLSSKSHWDVPIKTPQGSIHLLASHPTPPAFDGDEDRNGRRNHDEIRLWADYISDDCEYLYDDQKQSGGLAAGSHFVIAGDLNADPFDGSSHDGAIKQLTEHPLVNAVAPRCSGGSFYSHQQGGENVNHQGDADCDTADFNDRSVGNLRVDYALPSKTLTVKGSGVFWPRPSEAGAEEMKATDHRLVWIDVILPK